jgi:hypothetical protein
MAAFGIEGIRRFAGHDVRVRLADGTTYDGRLRTELLSELSLSVYLRMRRGEGVTVYIDQIAEIVTTDDLTP